MRRVTMLSCILCTCFAGGASVAKAEKTTTTTTKTVQRYDSGSGTPDCNSPGAGCTLTITTTVETSSVITPVSGGLLLHVGNTDMYGAVTRGGLLTYVPVVNRAIVFPSPSTVTIDESLAYPFLNGRTLDISGITTDVNGGYTIQFVP